MATAKKRATVKRKSVKRNDMIDLTKLIERIDTLSEINLEKLIK